MNVMNMFDEIDAQLMMGRFPMEMSKLSCF